MDRQLQQAQKMEAVGLLAGGVAHDFNNMLSVILSYGSIVMSELDEADPLREDVAEICEAGKRAAWLTQQLLTFSRKNVVVPTMVDVDEVLTGMGKMIGRLVGEHIEVETKLNAAGAVVLVDRGQLEQVVMNLVVNARDATVKGGRMTLETHVRGEDTAGEDSTSKHATIVVRDNGAGMDAQTMERVFEPFFTTKRRGSGTGLGLSTAYGIISKAGGRLHVSSRLGEGSVFTIELPISEHAQTRETISEAPDEHGPVSGATVLLVEDEREVRKLARRILERAGYRVLDADNAGTALLLLEEHPSPIDLLLTDVVMTHVSGPALAKRLKEQQPNIQVLFMTGYADDSYLKNEEMVSGHSLLLKPITPAKLIEKVREALVEDSG